jgi:hypothetical protein
MYKYTIRAEMAGGSLCRSGKELSIEIKMDGRTQRQKVNSGLQALFFVPCVFEINGRVTKKKLT